MTALQPWPPMPLLQVFPRAKPRHWRPEIVSVRGRPASATERGLSVRIIRLPWGVPWLVSYAVFENSADGYVRVLRQGGDNFATRRHAKAAADALWLMLVASERARVRHEAGRSAS